MQRIMHIHPILSALYNERLQYMRVETQLNHEINELQQQISNRVNWGGGAEEQLLQYRDLIDELSTIWDALIDTNHEIRHLKYILKKRSEAEICPLCKKEDCSLCIPF